MKKFLSWSVLLLLLIISCTPKKKYETKTAESNGYSYEYVTNDPLKVRIYTLENGLKVYLSQNDAQPRIQTQIAVKAGGKNDPADATGLAHYLEHIMFKGTADFGTLNWEEESVLLDSIENMFEHYRTLSDSVERVDYYALIDQVSNRAATLAIANEYDKMVSEIGAQGTNAYTSDDRTVYINDIPSNQLENWIQIEANRFQKIVPRLFHTELETVYEEKNRSLDSDYSKTYQAMNVSAFKKHPYGTQTVLGTIDHLKNPSITEIKKYFDKNYRPNNVAICLSGDLDYDKTIAEIDKNFGSWKPNENLTPWEKVEEDPIAEPVVMDVYGPDAEWVNIGFRFDGRNSEEYQVVRMIDMILANSQAGLIDLNLKQKQKVLQPSSYVSARNDYSIHTLTGKPREGQSLEQVKELLLEQVELVKKGEFDDWLIEAVINDFKISSLRQSEQNWSRSNDLVMAFTNGIPWAVYINENDALKNITKEDIIKFAKDHYSNNYVVVNKRNGKDPNALKVSKPQITKVPLNKEDVSPFHKAILENEVSKLQPVFLDYEKDVKRFELDKGVEVRYTNNKDNDLFTLYYLSDVGSNNDPKISVAIKYLEYLGTEEMSSEDFKKEFYKIGCDFGVFAAEDQTYIYVSGLSENMDKGVKLIEQLLANPKADDEALQLMIDGMFQEREDAKKDKWSIMFDGLNNFGLYGENSPFTNVLTNKELRELKPAELIDIIKGFTQMEHRVLYYGPLDQSALRASLNTNHILPDKLNPVPAPVDFEMTDVTDPVVYWTDYDMVQAEIMFLGKGVEFDKDLLPKAQVFNEYFGGNMSSPVFQELREAQGLAYSAYAYYGTASKKSANDEFYAYIGTQADKQAESMGAMLGLMKNFPRSENGFEVAKSSIMNRIESQRITKTGILFNYESAVRRGLDYDIRKDIYAQAQTMTLDDVEKFYNENINNQNFNVVILGSRDKLNFKDMQKYGKVQELTLDEIFGYEKVQKINVETPNQ